MRAAFDAGADIVEFDVHPTTDGHFAVFHDWTLDCRTDGKGVTREHTLAELKKLDVGYGYTADGGKTFPVPRHGRRPDAVARRGAGRLSRQALPHSHQEQRSARRRLLADAPRTRCRNSIARLMFYGGDLPVATSRERMPEIAHDVAQALTPA